MRLALFAFVVAVLASACTKVTYGNPTLRPTAQTHREKGHFFIMGLVGTADIDATQVCPAGVAQVQSKFTAGDVLLRIFTLGIYTPRTYDIACGSGGPQ